MLLRVRKEVTLLGTVEPSVSKTDLKKSDLFVSTIQGTDKSKKMSSHGTVS